MRIAVLVPARDYAEDWSWAFDVEAAALEGAGFRVTAVPWPELERPEDFDAILPLVAWGYHLRTADWLGLLDRLDQSPVPTINPPALLRWNGDKSYLAELGDKGVAAVPSRTVESLDEAALDAARSAFGCDELVIKPLVSAAADGTFRLSPDAPAPHSALGRRMLVQPFLPSITGEGEYSLILLGGTFSHCVVKRPRAGDFRVQPHLGGRDEAGAPPAGAMELAEAALAAAPTRATYARVDIVRAAEETLRIMELELIEPALFLHHAPGSAERFGSAIRAALQ